MSTWKNPLNDRNFTQPGEKNGLLHPPDCVCAKCAAGRQSRQLDPALREKLDEMLDATFLQMVQSNVMGGFQAAANNTPISAVRSGFLGNMANIFLMREMAAAYFAESEEAQE